MRYIYTILLVSCVLGASVGLFLGSVKGVRADFILPPDTISYTKHFVGEFDYVISSGSSTVLGFSSKQKNTASDTRLYCGNVEILDNFATSYDYLPLNYVCSSTLWLDKTGRDEAMIVVNYLPYTISKERTNTYNFVDFSEPIGIYATSVLPVSTSAPDQIYIGSTTFDLDTVPRDNRYIVVLLMILMVFAVFDFLRRLFAGRLN